MKIAQSEYILEVLNEGVDSSSGNCDVIVELSSGRRYGATFFTPKNISLLTERSKRTGEFAIGSYLWAAQMIVVESLQVEVISAAVQDL